MKTTVKKWSVALLLLPLACSNESDDPSTPVGVAGGAGTSASAGTGGDASGGTANAAGGTSGDGTPSAPTSDLPAPATTGVARPSGATDGLSVVSWAGFKAAVTYTLDDANQSQIDNYDALEALGVPYTFYLWGNMPGASNPVWGRAVMDGHELGNHTETHQMGDAPNIAEDTDIGEQFIESQFGVTVYTMAAPYGHIQYADVARTRYLINRGVGNGQIGANDNTDRFNLPTFIPALGAPAQNFNTRVDTARTNGAWETVLVHGFTGDAAAYQAVDVEQFVAAVNYTKSLGDVWIGTLLDVGAYWIAQKLVSTATPATAGTTTTWSWTLPDHFPPGHFLRVTVNGGTLSQSGVPLTWDEHGYYEVALDAGSVSLAP